MVIELMSLTKNKVQILIYVKMISETSIWETLKIFNTKE